MAEKNAHFNRPKYNYFTRFLEATNIWGICTDVKEARFLMGSILYNHTCQHIEECSCYVCTLLTTAYETDTHNWRFCSWQFDCHLCYNIVGEMMYIVLPQHWPYRRQW